MLTTSKQMLIDASQNGYAVPAINTQGGNYDIIWAICKAADDLRSRERHLNALNCIETLLAQEILPIINENDPISVDEL